MELTKEYFEEHLGRKLEAQTRELMAYSKGQTEELTRMVKTGFDQVDTQFARVDAQFAVVIDRLVAIKSSSLIRSSPSS